MSLVGFEWMPLFFTNRVFHMNTMKRVAYPDAMPYTLRVVFPHAKRSRMITFHIEPSTHTSGLIRVKVVTRPLTVPF